LTVLLLLLVSRTIVGFGKRVLLYFFERVTEDAPERLIPFTLTATLLAVLALLAKTLDHLFTG